MTEFNARSRSGQTKKTDRGTDENPVTSNGHALSGGNGHSASNGSTVLENDGDSVAKLNPYGTVILLPIEGELAHEMQRLRLPALFALDRGARQAVDRRRAIVVYRDARNLTFALQTANFFTEKCYCEQVGTLDLAEMGFEGEPGDWLAWWDEVLGVGHFEDRFDFIKVAAERTKWIDKRLSIEASEDEELVDPIGNVDPVAFHGVLGEIVNKLGPVTEANRLFVLVHLLAMCGASMGRTPKFGRGVNAYMNPQFVLIAPTAKGRKRTSRVIAEEAFRKVDKPFADNYIIDGLSSGRGLMENLRDASTRLGDKGKDIHDPGVTEKRRLFIEEELASVLKHGNRDSETLLLIIRQVADGKEKIHMATKSPITVTGAHLSIVGHGTPKETRSLLMDRDVSGGTWNRFVWLWGVKARDLPGGADVDGVLRDYLENETSQLTRILGNAKGVTSIMFAPKIADRWATVYRKLEDDTPSGPIADHYARAPTNVIRLACLFALLDGGWQIDDVHLDAALAIWGHSDRTLRYMFASDVNEDAEKLKTALRQSPGGLTKTQITRDVFKGRPPIGVDDILKDLLAERTILGKKVRPESGRPATLFVWNTWV